MKKFFPSMFGGVMFAPESGGEGGDPAPAVIDDEAQAGNESADESENSDESENDNGDDQAQDS